MIGRGLRPGQLMRSHGLGFAQADRLVRDHTLRHWRRYGWLGALALAALLADVVAAFADWKLPFSTTLLPGVGSVCVGLQLWLAQRAARPSILREADRLRGESTNSCD